MESFINPPSLRTPSNFPIYNEIKPLINPWTQCQENLTTKEKEHLVNVIARARNAILNAVKESTEKYFNDMRNMISDERFDVDIFNEETEKKEQKFVDEFESILEPTPSEISIKKEAERREDVQVRRE